MYTQIDGSGYCDQQYDPLSNKTTYILHGPATFHSPELSTDHPFYAYIKILTPACQWQMTFTRDVCIPAPIYGTTDSSTEKVFCDEMVVEYPHNTYEKFSIRFGVGDAAYGRGFNGIFGHPCIELYVGPDCSILIQPLTDDESQKKCDELADKRRIDFLDQLI